MGVISQNGIDYPVPSVPVQSDGSATDLTNAAVPTGQTIKSYLNSNLAPKSGTITFASGVSNHTDHSMLEKSGRVVQLSLHIKTTANISAWQVVGTLSENFRPRSVLFPIAYLSTGAVCQIRIGTDGGMLTSASLPSGTSLYAECTFIVSS